MPKFDVAIKHVIESQLQVTITAKDEDAARRKVEDQIDASGFEPATLAAFYQAAWEETESSLDVDDVSEV